MPPPRLARSAPRPRLLIGERLEPVKPTSGQVSCKDGLAPGIAGPESLAIVTGHLGLRLEHRASEERRTGLISVHCAWPPLRLHKFDDVTQEEGRHAERAKLPDMGHFVEESLP